MNELTVSENQFTYSVKAGEVKIDGLEEAKKKAQETLEQRKNLVIADYDQWQAAKKARAKLRKDAKGFKELGKLTTNQVLDSIKAIEDVKEIQKTYEQAASEEDKAVKIYEDQRKLDKHKIQLRELDKVAREYGLEVDDIEYQKKWDNFSVKLPTVIEEARKLFEKVESQRGLQREKRQEIIQLATSHGVYPTPYLELFNLGMHMSQIISMIAKAPKSNPDAPKEDTNKNTHTIKKVDSDTGEIVSEDPKKYEITFTVKGNFNQMKAISQNLTDSKAQVTVTKQLKEVQDELPSK